MTDAPIRACHAGRSAVLKWHRARRRADDPAFTAARVIEAMRAGASVEIDIRPLACGDFAVIHDAELDRETTGKGPVAMLDAAAFGALKRRDEAGLVLEEQALTLSALVHRLGGAFPTGALLQLDLKCGDADLTPAHLDRMGEAVGTLASSAILSGGDAEAVHRLTAAVPGLALGFDPCHDDSVVALARSGCFAEFVGNALSSAPEAAMIYLDLRLPILAAEHGADLIAPFQAAGKRVDCYTLPMTTSGVAAIAARLIALGADQITTDDPEGLVAALV